MPRNEEVRNYYLPSEIKSLLDNAQKPSSTFYTLVREQKIKKYAHAQAGTDVYAKTDVDAYLAGKLTKRGGKSRKRIQDSSPHLQTANVHEQKQAIDTAKPDDLLNLYLLESAQLDYLRAVMPPILHGWVQANDLIYWLLYNPQNRTEIVAMLGILPLSEDMIGRLRSTEITPLQIAPQEIQSYQPGKYYHCVIVSAATKAGQQDMILPLIMQVFSDWGKRSVHVESLYAFMPDNEDTPIARIIAQCGFTPLDEEGRQWRLRPFYRPFQPASFVRDYRATILNEKRKLKDMQVLQDEQKLTIDDMRQFFASRKAYRQRQDFTGSVLRNFVMQSDGRIARTDHQDQRVVFVRAIRDEHDMREAIRINASLFGASKKYTEDELVARRAPWVEKNADIYRVLEVDGKIYGFVLIMPFPQRILDRFLHGEIVVGDISLEDLLVYRPGETHDLFLQTLGLHKSIQGNEKRLFGAYLLAGIHQLFVDLAARGIRIGNLYARSNEIDGLNCGAMLDMDEIIVPGVTDKIVMKLDFSETTKKSLRAYREALATYERTHTVNNHVL